jgi:hypothetical protein
MPVKVLLRKDTAQSIAVRPLLDASKVTLSHSTPVSGESLWCTR